MYFSVNGNSRTAGFKVRRACVVAVACLIVGVLSAPAEQYTVNVTTQYQLFSSPFAAANGSPLAITNLVVASTGRLHVVLWDSRMQNYGAMPYRDTFGVWDNSASNKISRGEAFYMRTIQPGGTDRVTFTGFLSSASVITNHYTNGYNHWMGYPYLSAVAITNLNLTNNVVPYVFGDRIYTLETTSQTYDAFFYDADGELGGGWQSMEDPGHPTDVVLSPAEGFIYQIREYDTTMTWRAIAP